MSSDLPAIPDAISDLRTFRVFARRAVEGTLSGQHRSGTFGSSIEFAEHKPYSVGDDLRHIDWKVLARADKYYLKRFEDETNLRAYLNVDHSGSMRFGSVGYTKADYATLLSATLSYLLIQQQDLVGLLVFGDRTPTYVPPRGHMAHFQVITETLQQNNTRGNEKVNSAMEFLRQRIHRKALVILCSDFLAPDSEISNVAKLFPKRDYDVTWCHIVDPMELEFPFRDPITFRGLEEEKPLDVNASHVRRAYRQEIDRWLVHIRDCALTHDIRYRLVRTDEPIRQTLRSLLQ